MIVLVRSKVEAEFLGCVEGKIHLHKTNGVKIAVAADKLSVEDLEYVERVTGTSLEQYKEQVMKQQAKEQNQRANQVLLRLLPSTNETKYASSATAAINDIAPPKPQDHKQQHKYPIMVLHCMTGLTFP